MVNDSVATCLLRSGSQCKTAQRGERSPLPASFLPGQTERKPSSSWNKARRLRAKCWMDEPCRSTLADAPLQWSDLCRCRYQIECTCRCSTTQDWFMEMFLWASMHRDAAFYLQSIQPLIQQTEALFAVKAVTVPGLPHLLISDMLPGRRMETVHTGREKKHFFFHPQSFRPLSILSLTIKDYLCEYIVPPDCVDFNTLNMDVCCINIKWWSNNTSKHIRHAVKPHLSFFTLLTVNTWPLLQKNILAGVPS